MSDYNENPKTRRESKKTAEEKKNGKDRLGSGRGARAIEANQERAKQSVKGKFNKPIKTHGDDKNS